MERLHEATSKTEILLLLDGPSIDVNFQKENGDTALHTYVRRGKDGYDCLLILLSYCEPNVLAIDGCSEGLNTPLHLATQINNIDAVKALIAFGADVDAINFYGQTALDIALEGDFQDMIALLCSLDCEPGATVRSRLEKFVVLPKAPVLNEKECNGINWKELGHSYSRSLSNTKSLEAAENSYSAWLEWKKKKELLKKEKESHRVSNSPATPPVFHAKSGQRVLCLDGGGMRGLIQLEVLRQITESTGRNISELFQWVVGTSTGAIVALALVYGDLDISRLRTLYFEIKDKVFGSSRLGMACDTEALEQVLKRQFKDGRMVELKNGPNVLVSAVDKSTDQLELVWFNNCFHNKYYGEELWKVARCTSAAPLYFKPMEICRDNGPAIQYIDGGVRASNPSEDALTIIQDHLRGANIKVSLVVSCGCGSFPPLPLGDADVECYLFFGKHWLKFKEIYHKFQNFANMIGRAIDNSEQAAKNTFSRCREQGFPFYRFSPQFDDNIPLGETDDRTLCDMIVKARAYLNSQRTDMDELVCSFYYSKIQLMLPC